MRVPVIAVIWLALWQAAVADVLCPEVAKTPVQEGTRLPEEAFEVPAGLDAADKLVASLNKAKLSYQFEQVVDAFVIKGALLRQQALASQTTWELLALKSQTGAASKSDADKAAAVAKKSLDAFCAFMADAVVAE
jgi:hypothetical protein